MMFSSFGCMVKRLCWNFWIMLILIMKPLSTPGKSKEKLSYLDVLVSIKDNRISTDVYCKPTDTHQYLDSKSCHPRHVKNGIPYGQAPKFSIKDLRNLKVISLREVLRRI